MHQFQLSLQDLSPLPIPNRTANSIIPQVVDFLILDLKNNNSVNGANSSSGVPNSYHPNQHSDPLISEVPSTLLQLPSANNFGSSVFDDPRRDNFQQLGFNTNHLNAPSDLYLNRCQSGQIIPGINEFSHQFLTNNNNNTLADIDSINFKLDSIGMDFKKEPSNNINGKIPESEIDLKSPFFHDLLKQYPNQLFSQINPPFSPQQQPVLPLLNSLTGNMNPQSFLANLPFLSAAKSQDIQQQQIIANSMNQLTPSAIPTPTSFSSTSSAGNITKLPQLSHNNSLNSHSSAFSYSINSSIMAEMLKKQQEKNEQKGNNPSGQLLEDSYNKNTDSIVKNALNIDNNANINLMNNLKQISSILLPIKNQQENPFKSSELNAQQSSVFAQTAISPEENEDDSNQNKNERKIEEYARKVDFCKCKKSKCLKLYCECFLSGIFCNEQCICTECGNTPGNEAERIKAIEEAKGRNSEAFNLKFQVNQNQVTHKRGCNCKKTNCLKKYCECYNAGLKCRANCKCEECKNTQDNLKSLGESVTLKGNEDQQQISQLNNHLEGIISGSDAITPGIVTSQRERKISMCTSTTGSTILQTRKRTRSEALDTSLDQVTSLTVADDPGVRKKKSNFHALQQQQQQQQLDSEEALKQQIPDPKIDSKNQDISSQQLNSSQPVNSTNYSSFQQNFIFPEASKNVQIHTRKKPS